MINASSSHPGRLDGRVALVTGAGRGVGRATTLAYLREGARVLAVDSGCAVDGVGHDPEIVAELLRHVAKEMPEARHRLVVDASDVSEPAATQRLVTLCTEQLGPLDTLVCCHGIERERALVKTTDEDLDVVFQVHALSVFRLARAVARHMIDGKRGGTVLLATGAAGFFGTVRQTAIAAANAAIAGFVRSAAAELRRHEIRVNAFAPTARTRLTEGTALFQSIRPDSLSPEHVAPLLVFLAAEAGKNVSGEVLGIAGNRIYGLRVRETSGAFASSDAFGVDEITELWPSITKA